MMAMIHGYVMAVIHPAIMVVIPEPWQLWYTQP